MNDVAEPSVHASTERPRTTRPATKMTSRRRISASSIASAVAVTAAVALWSSPAAPQARSQFDQLSERFDGTWVLAIPEARAQAQVDRAVDQAVNAMNFFVRGVARPMLRDNTPLNRSIVLDFQDGERIRVRFPDTGWETTTRLGQTERAQSQGGDAMRVTQRFNDDGSLEQVFQTDQGTRWNVYTPASDGTLTLRATTNGSMMPQPMTFSLPYRRR